MTPPDRASVDERLERLLDLLRSDPPRPDESLAARIVRSARWQRPLRLVLVTGSHVGVGLVTGLASIVGIRKPQQ